MTQNYKSRGFTLIEIVVAVAIFAVISGIVFPALLQFLEMRERVVEKNTEVIGLQKTFLFLAKDLRYAANRVGKDQYGDKGTTTLSIGGDSVLDFTAIYPDFSLGGQGVPRRVQWLLEDDVLTRVQYPVIDPSSDTRRIDQLLLENIEDINIQVHEIQDGRNEVEKTWDEQTSLPNMIEIELTIKSGIKYRRVFTMLGGDASQIQAQAQAEAQGQGQPENEAN